MHSAIHGESKVSQCAYWAVAERALQSHKKGYWRQVQWAAVVYII